MSGPRVLIEGGRIVDPASGFDGTGVVCVADGVIVGVGSRPDGFEADHRIDAGGRIVCPGFIDLCARLREPGQEHKGTIVSEGAAAVAGGITTLCCPPDTTPVIDTPAVVKLVTERAEQAGKARVLPIGALTRSLNGKDLSEMHALKRAGCLALSNADRPLANLLVLRRALEYAASFGLVVVFRPEEPWLCSQGCVHEGAVSSRLGLPGIPETAETVAVAQALPLIEQTGVRAHFGQLSSGRAVEMVAEARARGVHVSADVAVHHLHLTESSVDGFDALCHSRPPFRTTADRDALLAAVADGRISAVCSDHQPHEPDAKLDVFPETEPGLSSLQTLLPLMYALVAEGRLPLSAAIARLTVGPAAILGLESGRLAPGAPADVCVFDPAAVWVPAEGGWVSAGRNTPFWERALTGRVTATLVGGRLVYPSETAS
ncbi:dihydroorotase [Methylococcus capsulatus]|uniref:dihydroorotase n=1 Tax=Methylococcus capsulatus TaxID=414 RepID=UPI001C529A84|nr:dihydroorotase [Methylococcus capsulatus]QXP91564.1 dihydroorotase [Methylococcus capsulatus]